MKWSRTPEAAQRNLVFGLLGFVLALLIPLGVILSRVYGELKANVFYRYQDAGGELALRIDERIATLLQTEEARTFDQYSFYSVGESQLLPEKAVGYSPLSSLPPPSTVPGMVGYFQLGPDGRFESPVLPPFGDSFIENAPPIFEPTELRKRQELKTKLERTVASANFRGTNPRSVAPSKKIAELNLDTALFEREQRGLSKKQDESVTQQALVINDLRNTRKTKFGTWNYAQTIGQGAANMAEPDLLTEQERRQTKPFPTEGMSVGKLNQPKIMSSTGEIDPFQLLRVNEHLIFYRKAWIGNSRYIQGFVVVSSAFLEQTMKNLFLTTTFGGVGTLLIAHRGDLLESYTAPTQTSLEFGSSSAAATSKQIVIFRRNLLAPFQDFELVLTVANLPIGPEVRVIDMLLLIMSAVLVVGSFGIYRLGACQIRLAKQQTDFVSAVSHELKTPLTSIRMYGELLRSGWVTDEEKKRSYYDFIYAESERLSRLIANVLELARLTRNSVALELQPYTASELLDLVQSKIRTQVEAAGFTLETSTPPDALPETVNTETDAFSQIIINLVDNALKFSKDAERKQIILGYRSDARAGEITYFVRDFGPGVSREEQRKIFTLFYRAGNELTRTTPGTGIGLALVQQLASLMNANVSMRNQSPGAEFQLTFKCNHRTGVGKA